MKITKIQILNQSEVDQGLLEESRISELENEILVLLQVLLWMISFAIGKPLTKKGCTLTSEIELYDPTDTEAEIECKKCPECPEGQGLTPQCGSRVPIDTKIECTPCKANVLYSDSHGIESCKPCHECGLKNIIQHCTPDKNRKCGTKCPEGYFLDGNSICQECYFCCDSASDSQRRQECIDIGMTRKWQCEKTEQNQHCKEKVTTTSTETELTAPPNHNTITMTGTHVKTQVHDKFATTLSHQPGQNLTLPQMLSVDGSTLTTVQGTTNFALPFPEKDDSANINAAQSRKKDKEQEHGAVSLRVVIGVGTIIFIISVLALMTSEPVKQFCQFSRTNQRNLEDDNELIPLNPICGHTDSGRASPQDIVNTEVPPLSWADNNLTTEQYEECGAEVCKPNPADIPTDIVTTEVPPLSLVDNNLTMEEHEECGNEVCKPNPEDIPSDCRISEMERLHDDEGSLMLFHVKRKLDALETSNRKTWRSIGQVFHVSSDELNMIETEYFARRSPTESLLELLKNREKEPTMREFVRALIICGRHDVANVISKWPWAKYFVPVCNDT